MSDAASHLRLATECVAGQRPYQEDAVLTESLSDGRTLVAVADGMGGHAAGEVASALALETLVEALEDGRTLGDAFELANGRVRAEADEPGKRGMGTTLVAAVVDGGSYQVANVGDSRGYLLSGDGIRQITKDHSFVAEAVDRGTPREEAEASKWRDALTRSIGTDAEVNVDLFGPFPVEPDSALLLCSDGLYKVLSDTAVKEVYARSGGPDGAAQALVAAALEGGSDDNISVAIAEFGEVPRVGAGDTQEMRWPPPDRAEQARPDRAGAERDPGAGPEAGETWLPGTPGITPWVVGAAAVVFLAIVIGILLALT
ncbi:MAG TPA: protein phosphatase 2C domain-containing protein [Longimicrobiales bacterium]|nr:protein phosphatase 2C domain-containing protein [Longimicrobiales bacterium]